MSTQTSRSATQVLADLLGLTDRFGEVVAAVADHQWDAPSPCEGWSAGDVVAHVVDSQRDFLAQRGVDLGERATGSPAELWAAHAQAVRATLSEAVLAREFDSFFGPSTVGAVLDTFYNLDLVVHRWDLAAATGRTTTFTDHELDLAEASLDLLGDNIHLHGACAPAIDLGDGPAGRQEQLLARTGRDPRCFPAG